MLFNSFQDSNAICLWQIALLSWKSVLVVTRIAEMGSTGDHFSVLATDGFKLVLFLLLNIFPRSSKLTVCADSVTNCVKRMKVFHLCLGAAESRVFRHRMSHITSQMLLRCCRLHTRTFWIHRDKT